MNSILTSIKSVKQEKLTSRTETLFIVSFKYELQNGYKLSNMQKKDIKTLQSFLDRVSGMSFQKVDKLYRRKQDKLVKYNNQDIIHYGFSDDFRIHGILENGRFKVIKIDPNHKVHR